LTLTCITSQVTVGRGSASHAGKTRTTASWRVVGLKISLALDGADARHRRGAQDGASGHSTVARSPNGGRAHRRGAQDGASGTLPLLALGRSSADEFARLLTAAQKREWRKLNEG
jgi:hypothetical protein